MSPYFLAAVVAAFPHSAAVGVPWQATVGVRAVVADGPSTLRATGTPLRRGGYRVTFRFPQPGTWRVRTAGGKGLGVVRVDVRRDPLLVDPFAIAVDADGALLVGQRDTGPLLRLAGGRARVAARGVGVFHVAPSGYVAASDGAVYRLAGSAFERVTPTLDANAVAADGAGNIYVTIYDGFVKRIAPGGAVKTLASGLEHPHSLALGDGVLYVADTEARRLRRIDLATGAMTAFGGDVGIVVALAVAPDGTVWSVDVPRDGAGGGVMRTTRDGITGRVSTLRDANGIAVAPGGAVYVNRWQAKRIDRLDVRTGRLEPIARG